MKENNYEQRFIRNSINNIEFSIFEDENKKTLSDLLFENDKIVLLGNPGVGKTIELKELFEKLWKNKDESINFPFFINIKNFRKTSKFEDLIPYENWKELPTKTFILDGLVKIANSPTLYTTLQNLLAKYKEWQKTAISNNVGAFEKIFQHQQNY
jgi:predicted NACHT family NTPase